MLKKIRVFIYLLSSVAALTACTNGPAKMEDKLVQTEVPSVTEETIQSEYTSESIEKADILPAETVNEIDLSKYFEGINGCAVFFYPDKLTYNIYNVELSEKESSPCSTFKIISSLMGLENGVIDPAASVYSWNGTEYWKSEWNKDIGFEEAFKTSCVVFQRSGEPTGSGYYPGYFGRIRIWKL